VSHYFDANATTPLRPEARAAWLEAADDHWHNPSSPYRAAAAVHARLEQARTDLAAMFYAPAESLIFNSGATEGNRDVFAYWGQVEPSKRVGVSAIEHPAVLENAQAIWRDSVVVLPVDEQGRLRLDALESELRQGLSLVSLMAANNETGVLQPWRECLELCRQHRAALHIDATQWVGKEPLEGLADAAFVTGSGHKFGGPKGVGFLLVSANYSGFVGQRGGAQENDHRAGTENFPAIAGMVAALRAQEVERSEVNARWRMGRDELETLLIGAISELKVWGNEAPRLANTSSHSLPKGDNARWVRRLDQRGFQVSTGSACSTGREGPSHVLAAMGSSAEAARRSIRISAPYDSSVADWVELAETLIDLWRTRDSGSSESQVIQI